MSSYAESVRDVQFSPHQPNVFASVSENGTVQLWDVRRQDRCQNQFTAHHGPIFACDWHPEVKTWLATAGRDKAVKIWDLGFKNVLEYSVATMASVGRIKWRPHSSYLIQHVIGDAERPTEKANPVCVAYDCRGNLTLAAADKSWTKALKATSMLVIVEFRFLSSIH